MSTAAKVVVVGALARIASPSSRDALARARLTYAASSPFAAAKTVPTDPFEAELRQELVTAIDAAMR